MAATHGKDGAAYNGANLIANVESWEGDHNTDWVETQALQDDYLESTAGIQRMTGRLNCFWDEADTNGQVACMTAVTTPSTVRLYLYVNASNYFEFNAYLDGGFNVSISDVVRRNFTYRSEGTIAYN